MHLPLSADDRIDGAGWQAARAADAFRFVDDRDGGWFLDSAGLIERQRVDLEQLREKADGCGASGRAAIDGSLARSDGFGIRATALIAAARALSLRQKRVDAVGVGAHHEGLISYAQEIFMPPATPSSAESR
jgi:hypothetical protein